MFYSEIIKKINMQIGFSEQACIPDSIFEKKVNDVIYVKPFIPKGIAIKKSVNLTTFDHVHYGVFAKRTFKKGENLWSSYANVIALHEKQPSYLYFMFNVSNIGYIPVSFYEHMVHDSTMGAYEGFSCIMNHSCDPNSTSIEQDEINNVRNSPFKCFFRQIALRDISAGEEITTNYLLFYGGAEDDEGFICHCGSKNCCGRINGFKNLPIEKQKELLPYLHSYFRKSWGV